MLSWAGRGRGLHLQTSSHLGLGPGSCELSFPASQQDPRSGPGRREVECLGRWFKLLEILGRMCVNDKEGVSRDLLQEGTL